MDDKRIIELFRRRDERAIEECSKSYGKLMNSVARGILGSREDAEECVQDGLHKLWESFPSEPIVSLRAYLVTIVRNYALLKLRSSSAERRGGGEYDLALSEFADCLPSPKSVEAQVEARETAKAIERWLGTLSADDRALFVRRCIIGDPVSMLAEETGRSAASVSKRLHRLREKLRKYLVKENLV